MEWPILVEDELCLRLSCGENNTAPHSATIAEGSGGNAIGKKEIQHHLGYHPTTKDDLDEEEMDDETMMEEVDPGGQAIEIH